MSLECMWERFLGERLLDIFYFDEKNTNCNGDVKMSFCLKMKVTNHEHFG